MNNNLKVLIGAAIGGGIGYFIAGVVIEVIRLKQDTDTLEELDQIDDAYGGPTEDEQLDPKEPVIVMGHKRTTKPIGKVTKNYAEIFQKRPDIAALVEKYNGEKGPRAKLTSEEAMTELIDDATLVTNTLQIEEPYTEQDEVEDLDYSDEPLSEEPTVISFQEYQELTDELQTVKLLFYDDDVITDERDNPIDKPERILGTEYMTSFDEDDTVYVRNLSRKALYEIVRTNKDYAPPIRRRPVDEAIARKRAKEEENASEDRTT